MKINLIGNIYENSHLETITTSSEVHAWFLHKALVEDGVDARLIHVSKLLKGVLPKTDYTIVVLPMDFVCILEEGGYLQKLRLTTTGKVVCYMDTDKLRGDSDQSFDHCFTRIKPRSSCPEKYIHAGWGVDPDYSYPEQDEKAAFLDSKVLSPQMTQKAENIYQIYDNVLSKLDMKIYNPVVTYNRSKRLPYPDYQSILRKCHYFLCTHFGEGEANHLEAAACGALLVVPLKLYRKRSMKLINHRLWHTEEGLIEALNEDVDIKANRQRALEHTWDKVAKRILDVLRS